MMQCDGRLMNLYSLIYFLQDVHVHLPGWTGGPDALWHVPSSGVKDGMHSP